MTAISEPSDNLAGNFVILVYPPDTFSYFGDNSLIIFFAPTLPIFATSDLCAATLLDLPDVTNFSTNGRSSLAFASVVLILPFNTKDKARDCRFR